MGGCPHDRRPIAGVRLNLEPIEERRLGNGVVVLRQVVRV